MTRLLTCLLAFSVLLPLSAQAPVFKFLEAEYFAEGSDELYQVSVDVEQLEAQLRKAPLELQGLKSNVTISLPLPNGTFADFRVLKSPIIPNHPELGSFKLRGPWGSGRMAMSTSGIHMMAKGPTGYFMVTPTPEVPDQHRVSSVRDYLTQAATENMGAFSCGNTSDEILDLNFPETATILSTADKSANDPQSLHIYDMALTCTGEFARNFGGTTSGVQDAFNVAMNLINAIYENDLGIRINLLDVPGLIYLDPDTDPYSESDNGFALLDQIQPALDSNNVASTSYDLAHILYSGCSGLLGVAPGLVCNDAAGRNKIEGASCIRSSLFDADVLSTMTHEIGHQFSGSHTWSRCAANTGEGWANFAVEPGGGSTIMAYGSICGDQTFSAVGPYFHSISVEQIGNYTRFSNGAPCATVVETDNLTPTVEFDYEDGFVIPVGTPFRLEGSASDTNDDALTFNWEQFNTDRGFSGLGTPTGDAPIFRSVLPSEGGWQRYFPQLDLIIQNIDSREERLPTYSRDLTFRLTARDNNAAAGGAGWKQLDFRADETAGPFLVNNPDSSSWLVGDYAEVTWEVANTDIAPVNCKRVNILLSTDGGQTFDVVLAENVANNGSAFVTVPEALSADALIMIEAADNIFLNVNQNSFQILPAVVPGFTLEPSIRFDEACLPEVIDIDLNSGSILDFAAPIALSIDTAGIPAGGIVSFSSAELTPGETSTMSVDLTNVRFNGVLELTIIAVVEGLDTARRSVLLELTDNDYSDLATITPAEGTAGIILATNFDWTDAVNADTYEIEIGTSPTFQESTIFERAGDLTNSEYLPAEFFEANTLYFWRIRPSNICGFGPWSAPQSFRTINSACNSFTPDDVPVGLPGSGPSFTRESRLFIEQSGAISDLNLPNVNVQYNFASAVTLTLISPAGTRVALYEENCFSTNKIDLGFDDDAPIPVSCPPDDQRVFRPTGSLADFTGEDTFGEWILEVKVSETGGSAGSIQGWEVEFCADIAAVAPQAINNTPTEVLPLGSSVILKEKLNVTSTAFMNEMVQYTITDLPDAGRLMLYGAELMVGDTFQQDDINGLGLFYENTDDSFDTDDFGFLVTTPDGGYLPITYHDILITEDAVTSSRSHSTIDAGLVAFPNPVDNVLSIRWETALNRPLSLEVFDINGRMLRKKAVAGATKSASLDMTALPAGVYLLRIDGAVRRIVKR